MRAPTAALLTLLCLAGCAPSGSEPVLSPTEYGRVEGVVVDALRDEPVAGVRVRAHGLATTTSDDAGRFALTLPPGEHRLWLDVRGYVSGQRAHVVLRPGITTRVRAEIFPTRAEDELVQAYFSRRPQPAHELPPEESGGVASSTEVAGAVAALTEPPPLPAEIRVWRSSRAGALAPTAANGWADKSCDPAAEVLTLPLEDYVKGVIPHEWIPTWDPEALRAGAIVARTYAVRWALSGGRWACADVDDGTLTQVYRDDRAATTDEAVDATAGQVVMRGDALVNTEYSAENADPTAYGVDEPTCSGTARFGHGRGMCQWGTQRWAKGICANPPCDFGAFGPEPKDHLWMVEHYYPGATVLGGTSAPVPPCKLIPPEGDILDDAGPCFDAFGDPAYWRMETAGWAGGLHWTNAFEAAAPGNWARWRMFFAEPGEYEVEVYVDPAFGVHRTTRYSVTHAGGDAEVILDQGVADGWTRLGVWSFEAQGEVSVYDNEAAPVATDQHIVADAVRLTRVVATTDAGSDGGADAGTDAGVDATVPDGSTSDAADASATPHSGGATGGCGCRAAGGNTPPWAAVAVFVAILAVRRRS